ncbi:neuronal acetylcholine receptor subunit alpha-7-like, partial [Saccostrea cucullata]|uniref:neuronal acetylcholine receptor subunit alpha-7-like n=1 Tax=Saccostrea cuccullata TaxID=36930 RepID=UPI002ED3EC86
MRLNTIHEVEEHLQYISFTAWFDVKWTDDYLIWNETSYSEMTSITVPEQKVWVPDLYLYYSDEKINALGSPTIISVTSNGHMTWIPGGKFKISCYLKMKKFPFDNQTCLLTLSAWITSDSSQKLTPVQPSTDESFITQNGEWDITSFTHRVLYLSEYEMTVLQYELHLKRRYLYFVFSTLVPILALSLMNSLTFLIPLESGERIQYSLTLLLAFTVFLTLFEQTMPQSSVDIPYLTLYVDFQLCFSVMSTVISVISRLKTSRNDNKESNYKNRSRTCTSQCGCRTKDRNQNKTSESDGREQ